MPKLKIQPWLAQVAKSKNVFSQYRWFGCLHDSVRPPATFMHGANPCDHPSVTTGFLLFAGFCLSTSADCSVATRFKEFGKQAAFQRMTFLLQLILIASGLRRTQNGARGGVHCHNESLSACINGADHHCLPSKPAHNLASWFSEIIISDRASPFQSGFVAPERQVGLEVRRHFRLRHCWPIRSRP